MMAGAYDAVERILKLWYPEPVHLKDDAAMKTMFDEAKREWFSRYLSGDAKLALLIDLSNLHVSPTLVDAFAAELRPMLPRLLGVYRYNAPKDFTGVALSLGAVRAEERSAPLYPDEASARAAIRAARQAQ
jgi:hypothetical protein